MGQALYCVLTMCNGTAMYGHSRGYRTLAVVAFLALVLSVTTILAPRPPGPVAYLGAAGFLVLLLFACFRAVQRTVVMTIEAEGFCFCDPAISLGLVDFDQIEEIRIYATLARPVVAFRLLDPGLLRRRLPLTMRTVLGLIWRTRRYQVVTELDRFNDQVAAVRSTAIKAGIPVVSELV